MSRVLAAIDVGTHAVRLKMARRTPAGLLEVIHQERAAVRPGEGVFQSGRISGSATDRLCQTLERFARRGQKHSARVRAVATSALREANNSEAVLRRVRDACGLALEVISPAEEARLACLGVLAGAPPERRSLCLDLGGGSTEVVLAHGERPVRSWSMPLGSMRLMQSVSSRALDDLRHQAYRSAALLPRGLESDDRLMVALGCSGSVRALVQFAVSGTRDRASLAELQRATEDIAELSMSARASAFGERRSESILPAAVVLEAVTRRLGLRSVQAVKRGLRDGLLIDMSRSSPGLLDHSTGEHAQAIAAPIHGAAQEAMDPGAGQQQIFER